MNKTLIATALISTLALVGCKTTETQPAKKSTTSVVKKAQATTQSQVKQQTQAVQTAKTQVVDQAKAQADAAAQAQAELARKIELSRQQAQAEIERRMALDRQMAEQAYARTAQQTQQRTNANQTQYMYMCNLGATVKAVYNANSETATLNVYAPILNLGNQDLNLKLAPSASGALYTNGKYEWHTNGGTGVLSAQGSSHQLKCEGDVMP